MAKLIINIKEGILEVETEDNTFIEKVYTDFKATIADQITQKIDNIGKNIENNDKKVTPMLLDPKAESTTPHKTRKTTKGNETYQQNASLILWKIDDRVDLKQFYIDKNPSTGYECNVVFVYYLQKIVKTEKITPQDIYTCYKHVERRYPTALRQNLIDTNDDKGWINTSNIQAIILTPKGENYVEHELPLRQDTVKK